MSERLRAHGAIITANILFGLNYSYSKSIIPNWMLPEGLVLARMTSAALMFVLLAYTFVKERVDRKDIGKLVLAALFGIAGNQYIFLKGLNLTSPVDAAIIATTGPVLVLIISAILKRDKITYLKSVGIVVGAAGALLVILYGGMSRLGTGNLAGNLMVFVSALSYAGYLIVIKDFMAKYSPMTVMAWVFGISAIVMTPLLFDDFVSGTKWHEIPPSILGAIIFVIVGATWLAYVCVAASLKSLKPTTVSIYSYSQPVIASFVAILRGQDSFDWVKVAAAGLVFLGVFIVMQAYRFERD